MYTQKIEYKEDKNKTGSGWKEVRARYTKQCGSEIIKEEGTMRIEGTSIYWLIQLYNLDRSTAFRPTDWPAKVFSSQWLKLDFHSSEFHQPSHGYWKNGLW